MIFVCIVLCIAFAYGGYSFRRLTTSAKPCPPTQEPSPDNIELYRVLAAIRDRQNLTAVSVLTEDYTTRYPTEFLTNKVEVDIGIAGYIYSIKKR